MGEDLVSDERFDPVFRTSGFALRLKKALREFLPHQPLAWARFMGC